MEQGGYIVVIIVAYWHYCCLCAVSDHGEAVQTPNVFA